MNIILCGYNWSGCQALDILKQKKNKIFVYTHKSKYFEPNLLDYCERIKVPTSIKKITKKNLPFMPDLIISVSYKYKIPADVLNCSKFKPFNLHPSLLPQYKGCSSVTWAMVNNEEYTGFSYHYMNNKFDDGNIIFQKKIKIKNFDLQNTIYYRVMFDSLNYLEDVIKLVKSGYKGKKQIGNSSYYRRGAPYNGKIEKKWSKEKKTRFIKAMINPPWPLSTYKGKKIKNYKDLI